MREWKEVVFEWQRVDFALKFVEQTEWRRISKNILHSDQTLEMMGYRPAFCYYGRIVGVAEKMDLGPELLPKSSQTCCAMNIRSHGNMCKCMKMLLILLRSICRELGIG